MNVFKFIFLLLVISPFYSCNTESDNRIYIGYNDFYIIDYDSKKGNLLTIYDSVTSKACWEWELQKEDLSNIFNSTIPIDEAIQYYPAPCSYVFKVKSSDTIAELTVNSNGIIVLSKLTNQQLNNRTNLFDLELLPNPDAIIYKKSIVSNHKSIKFPTLLVEYDGECLGG